MVMLLVELFCVAVVCMLVDLFTYKYVRYLDKKERKKLQAKETEYLKEMWAEWDKRKEEKKEKTGEIENV